MNVIGNTPGHTTTSFLLVSLYNHYDHSALGPVAPRTLTVDQQTVLDTWGQPRRFSVGWEISKRIGTDTLSRLYHIKKKEDWADKDDENVQFLRKRELWPRLTYEKDIRGAPLKGHALDSDEVLTRIIEVLDCSAMIKLLTDDQNHDQRLVYNWSWAVLLLTWGLKFNTRTLVQHKRLVLTAAWYELAKEYGRAYHQEQDPTCTVEHNQSKGKANPAEICLVWPSFRNPIYPSPSLRGVNTKWSNYHWPLSVSYLRNMLLDLQMTLSNPLNNLWDPDKAHQIRAHRLRIQQTLVLLKEFDMVVQITRMTGTRPLLPNTPGLLRCLFNWNDKIFGHNSNDPLCTRTLGSPSKRQDFRKEVQETFEKHMDAYFFDPATKRNPPRTTNRNTNAWVDRRPNPQRTPRKPRQRNPGTTRGPNPPYSPILSQRDIMNSGICLKFCQGICPNKGATCRFIHDPTIRQRWTNQTNRALGRQTTPIRSRPPRGRGAPRGRGRGRGKGRGPPP